MTETHPTQDPTTQPPAPPAQNGAPPRWAPYYGISFGKAIGRFFTKYATFSGRASRSEFWWAYLLNVVVSFVLLGVILALRWSTIEYDTVDFGDGNVYQVAQAPAPWFWALFLLPTLWWLATIVPTLALGWRRLHDANLAGALWIIAVFVGIVGIVFGLLPSNPEGARYDRPEAAR